MLQQRFLILVLVCTLFNTVQAQTWPMPGAKWRYCKGYNHYGSADSAGEYYDLAYTNDTSINGKTYNIIRLVGTKQQPTITGYQQMSLYTRYSNDTVYRYVNSKEYIYFIFGALVNDVWQTFRTAPKEWQDSTCTSFLPIKVKSESVVTYSGQNFRSISLLDTTYLKFNGTNNAVHRHEYKLVERMGVTNAFPLITLDYSYKQHCSDSSMIIEGYSYVSLSYYKDDTFEHQWYECKSSSIAEEELEKENVELYPNPINDKLTIRLNNNKNKHFVRIYNVLGESVLEKEVSGYESILDVKELKNGFYTISINQLNEINNVSFKVICVNK